jgi:hypothetical protein
MPNGVVQIYSTVLSMSEIKQIIMFSNDGDKIQNNYLYQLKKIKQKDHDA